MDPASGNDAQKSLGDEGPPPVRVRSGQKWERHDHAAVSRQVFEGPQDSLGSILEDRLAAAGAVGNGQPGIEQLKIIVDFRDGSDGRTGAPHGGAGFDGDTRGNSVNQVRLGRVHPFEKLAGIRGEGLHVTSLAFRVQSVDGQAGLARAAHAGDGDQPVQREIQVDVPEIVLGDAPQAYVVGSVQGSFLKGTWRVQK